MNNPLQKLRDLEPGTCFESMGQIWRKAAQPIEQDNEYWHAELLDGSDVGFPDDDVSVKVVDDPESA